MPTTGTVIQASDYNTIATSLVSIYGTGTGDRGYGLTAITPATETVGVPVTTADWNLLGSIATLLGLHQGTSIVGLSDTGTILASPLQTLLTEAASLVTNRFNVSGGETALSPNQLTNTRSSTWGGTGLPSITSTFDVSWADEDTARHFFNAGGQIRLRLAHPSTASQQDLDWGNTLSVLIGLVTISANSTTNSGSSQHSAGGVGYFEIAATPSAIYSGVGIGGGAYAANGVVINASRLNFGGVRGGNGNGFRISVVLFDSHTNLIAYDDSVHSGTSLAVDVLRSVTHVSTPLPSVVQIASF